MEKHKREEQEKNLLKYLQMEASVLAELIQCVYSLNWNNPRTVFHLGILIISLLLTHEAT